MNNLRGAKRKLNINVDLSNYYTKSETYSKIEINELLDAIEVTKTELDVLISENKLEPNRLYKITGVESWCFSQHLIKAIYLKAITNNTLEIEGVGEFYTPKYNTSDSNLGIWKGELFANGMIDSASYNIGDKVIWGNLFWENISGNIGTNEKEVEGLGSLKIDNYLSEVDWQLITPNNDESLYNIQFDAIKYDIENDYINYRADDLGNVYEITYNRLLTVHPNYNLAITEDPTFIYYLNAISLFQWGRDNVYNNIINESFVQNCNYNPTAFYDNTFESSRMHENNFLNVSIIGNYFKNASIARNYLKTYGGIRYNTLENSKIVSNRYYFEIRNNTLKNNSSIINNNDNNIIVGTNYSIIKGNTLDNSSTISNNIFVEEGNGVSGYRKGIYDNVLTTYCNINNNTIKNGSRIFGHTMNYYSTINGNTLDTDSNIYNNQVIQNGKIDNNILTGHGRIYGNQLDRRSEITLCKLRISPATSYSSGIHSTRLFKGKIQNIDFGNIVNPVGTNPNDPDFGGNTLSDCIIENSSVIKDLTFPNHGGISIQFVKMNGYSEFKNITVNNPIINVDFINTIFNETSDYSKLIEGSSHQTNGFTKTYIDGVLLQDRFDEKQDVLNYTPENITNKSDSYTASSSTTYASSKALVDGLSTKLDKPTTTGNTTNFPYVVGEDGNGNSARLPAGDLGKNFFNSDLSNTTARNHTMNAGVTVNTLGNPYSITGLPNKESDTTNFDKVLKYNPSTGQFAYGQAFVYNVPSTITVNHVNAPASPDVPSYIQAIQDRLTQLNQSGVVMQKFTDWNIVTLNNLQNANTNVQNNETINTYLQPFFDDSSIAVGTDIISIHSSKVLPRNSDFAIRFSVKLGHNGVPLYNQIGSVTNRLIGLFTGTVGGLSSPELYIYDSAGDYSYNLLSLQSVGAGVKTISGRASTDTSTIIHTGNQLASINFIILKVGDNILVQANYGVKTLSEIYSASVIGSGDFGFCVKVQKPGWSNWAIGIVNNIRYYIFP